MFGFCFLFVILGQFYEEGVFNISQMLFNVRWVGVLINGRTLRQCSMRPPVHYSTLLSTMLLNIYYDVPVLKDSYFFRLFIFSPMAKKQKPKAV